MAVPQKDMVAGPDAMAMRFFMRLVVTVVMLLGVTMIVIMVMPVSMPVSMTVRVEGMVVRHDVILRQFDQQGVKFKSENV